jgi:hypothetical protein
MVVVVLMLPLKVPLFTITVWSFSQVCFIFAMMVWVEDRGSCCLVLMPVSAVSGDLICCRYHLWEAMCCGCGRSNVLWLWSIDRSILCGGWPVWREFHLSWLLIPTYVSRFELLYWSFKEKMVVLVRIPFVLRTDSYICK